MLLGTGDSRTIDLGKHANIHTTLKNVLLLWDVFGVFVEMFHSFDPAFLSPCSRTRNILATGFSADGFVKDAVKLSK